MANKDGSRPDMSVSKSDDVLEGTTRKVFRYIYRQSSPVGIHDIQRGLDLSSPSVAYYHVNKLLKAGLLKEEGEGYLANKSVFENMIRIRKTALPLQTAYAVFFLAAFLILMTALRPAILNSAYFFATAVVFISFCVTSFEAYKVSRSQY